MRRRKLDHHDQCWNSRKQKCHGDVRCTCTAKAAPGRKCIFRHSGMDERHIGPQAEVVGLAEAAVEAAQAEFGPDDTGQTHCSHPR